MNSRSDISTNDNTPSDMFSIARVSYEEAYAGIDALSDVLVDCVEGGASVSFMLPINRSTAVNFWTKVVADVKEGKRALLIARDAQEEIVGTVQLILDLPENQPHRADVAKMLVHRRARRAGVAQRLLSTLEQVAKQERRTVLVLDTVTGGDAERLYARMGWQRVGTVPDYALMPDGKLCSTTFFHKKL